MMSDIVDHARTAEDIERFGRSILIVGEGEEGWPFSYTIGNHLRELPELLIIGTSRGGALLNALSQKMIDAGKPFENGQLVSVGGRLPVKVIRCNVAAAQTDYTIQVGEYFGHQDYSVMQVLLPDRSGKFPGEDGCQPLWSECPVLRPS
jgi:Domain of unknown function (DUF4262)